jgi:hypothetical protein
MRMRCSAANVLAGAASVRLYPNLTDPHRLLDDVYARAAAEGVPAEQALSRCMAERLLGQVLFTGLSLAGLGLAAAGAWANWPDGVVVPLALLPAALPVAVTWAQSRVGRAHKSAC